MCTKDHPCCQNFLKDTLIFIFEGLGTALLSMLFISAQASVGFMIGFVVLYLMIVKITGAHMNPIVTLAYMLCNEHKDTFHRW